MKFYHDIPIIKSVVYNMIKNSYYGGNILLRSQYNENYVNSLYPYSMKNMINI